MEHAADLRVARRAGSDPQQKAHQEEHVGRVESSRMPGRPGRTLCTADWRLDEFDRVATASGYPTVLRCNNGPNSPARRWRPSHRERRRHLGLAGASDLKAVGIDEEWRHEKGCCLAALAESTEGLPTMTRLLPSHGAHARRVPDERLGRRGNADESGSRPSHTWPALPYDEWRATCDTLHAHTQVLGKLAVALAPPEPQLQHAALRLTARGWETAPLPAPDGSGALVVALDLRTHQAVIEHNDGRTLRVPLTPDRPVGQVTRDLLDAVAQLGGPANINPRPQEVLWTVPLDQDDEHHTTPPRWRPISARPPTLRSCWPKSAPPTAAGPVQ
jgi:hypothetical protein